MIYLGLGQFGSGRRRGNDCGVGCFGGLRHRRRLVYGNTRERGGCFAIGLVWK